MTIYQIMSIVSIFIIASVSVILGIFLKSKKVWRILFLVGCGLIFLSVSALLLSPYNGRNGNSRALDFMDATKSIISGRYQGLMTKKESMLIIIYSLFPAITFGVFVTSAFFDGKALRLYRMSFPLIAIIFDVVFFDLIVHAYCGNYEENVTLHQLEIMLQVITFSYAFAINLVYEIKFRLKEEPLTKKNWIRSVLILPLLIFLFMIPSIFWNLFGNYNGKASEFSKEHIYVMSLIVVLLVGGFIILRKKDMTEKSVFLMLLALSAYHQYFISWYNFASSLSALPLHICNTAVILMPISLGFKRKGLFYFTYFINVVGALFAIVSPNGNDFYTVTEFEYWSNHVIDVVFPILAVMLGVMERPTLKNILQALAVFTVYITIVQFMGAYINRDIFVEGASGIQYGEEISRGGIPVEVDFFFLYKNKFVDIDMLRKLATTLKNHVVHFEYKGHTYVMFPLYTIGIYIGYIIFTLIAWFLWDRIYLLREDIALIKYKTKLKNEKIGKTSKKEVEEIKKLMGGKTMIKITDFGKRYGSSKDFSVRHFNLTIEDGDVFGFIGHNGAGKSTVIKSLVGIQSITEGNIEVCGFDIEKYPLQAKLNIGYVSDNHAVYEKLTGREYINYVADLYQVPKDVREERIKHYGDMFGLTPALDREAKSYSHGMKQKLVVISSLIHEPKVWVLDEPLTGLDPTSSYQIKECMKEHASKGNIVFFSTHVIEVIEKLCTKIAIISHGEMMGVYKIEDLKKDGISLESLYLKYVVSDDNRGQFSAEDIATTDAGLFIEQMKKEEKEETQE